MNYNIYVNDQLFKTISTDDGYEYTEIVREIMQAKENNQLGDIGPGLSIRIEQQ